MANTEESQGILSQAREPLGSMLEPLGELADSTAKGILAFPGIETLKGQSEVTYTDNAKTITSIDTDLMGFVVSAATNLFVGQCIKIGTVEQIVVITEIDTLKISVDRLILTTVLATEAVTESAYYSAYRQDKDLKESGGWKNYATYFFLELKRDETEDRCDIVFKNSVNIADYEIDLNISTKPISMVKINALNACGALYYFKSF